MGKDAKEMDVTSETVKPRKSKGSVSYSLKAIGPHIDTISDAGYLSAEVAGNMKNNIRQAKERYIKEQYGL